MQEVPFNPNPMVAAEPVMMRPPVAEAAAAQDVQTGRRLTRSVAAGVVAGALLISGSVVGVAMNRSEASPAHSADVLPPPDPAGVAAGEACPDGVFQNGSFESSLDISNVGDLSRRPTAPLNTKEELTSFYFGKDGVACESAAVLAVVKQAYVGMLGEGATKTFKFDVFGSVEEQTDIYVKNHDAAESDANKLAAQMQANSTLNTAELTGSYELVTGITAGDTVQARTKKIDKTFAPQTAFVTILAGDGSATEVPKIMVVDRATAQIYLLNFLGVIPEMSPEEAQAQEANGGGQFGEANGNGEANQPGNVPENGNNGGFTPGTTESFGPGPTVSPPTGNGTPPEVSTSTVVVTTLPPNTTVSTSTTTSTPETTSTTAKGSEPKPKPGTPN